MDFAESCSSWEFNEFSKSQHATWRILRSFDGILCKIVHGKRIAGHDEYVHQNRENEKE